MKNCILRHLEKWLMQQLPVKFEKKLNIKKLIIRLRSHFWIFFSNDPKKKREIYSLNFIKNLEQKKKLIIWCRSLFQMRRWRSKRKSPFSTFLGKRKKRLRNFERTHFTQIGLILKGYVVGYQKPKNPQILMKGRGDFIFSCCVLIYSVFSWYDE